MGRDSTPLMEELPLKQDLLQSVTHSGGARRSKDTAQPSASPGEGAEGGSSLGTDTQTPGRAGTRAWPLCRIPEKAITCSSPSAPC